MKEQALSNWIPDDLVDVVLPCYNVAEWIDEFMRGLMTHDKVNWRLIARDDGSKDGTLARLKGWQARLGPRMWLIDSDSPRNLGLIGNYDAVLSAATADWVFTADPDDVWLPNHLPIVLSALKAAEAKAGPAAPVAVCTDAAVVDANLVPVAPSFWRWSRNRPPRHLRLVRSAMDSVALGSTMAVNRALLERALPLPKGAAYQDWWMVLVAVAFGHFVALPEITIQYRRHGDNATKDPLSASLDHQMTLRKILGVPQRANSRLSYLIGQAGRQADVFATRYGGQLNKVDVAALRQLAALPQMSMIERRLTIMRHGLWFNSILKNIGLMVFI